MAEDLGVPSEACCMRVLPAARRLVVGLGNPGPAYEATRHNAGFWVIDAFCARYNIPLREKKGMSRIGRGTWHNTEGEGGSGDPSPSVDFLLAKPETFMNRSGSAVLALLTAFQIDLTDLIVIYDDLDMACGRVRIRTKGSAGGHRGVASIISAVHSDRFLRMKIGIGHNAGYDATDYVLTPFSKQEKAVMQAGVERCVEALPWLLEGKAAEAMNRYNPLCD